MLAWLLALLYLVSASLVPESPGPDIEKVLPADILSTIITSGGLATLCQAAYVSKSFSSLACPVIRARYGIRHGEMFYLNYTSILQELAVLVHQAEAKYGKDKAGAALKSCPDYVLLRSTLVAEFGYCISHVRGYLVTLALEKLPFDTLNDKRKISVLPYVLDENLDDPRCMHFIRGLADLGRCDLLGQMTFAAITTGCFYELMSFSLPGSVIQIAAKSLQSNVPDSELSSVLFWAGLGGQAVLPPDNCKLPLFALQYFSDERIPALQNCEFTGGLEEASMSFWVHVLNAGTERAQGLLNTVLVKGNAESKCLASAFYGQTAAINPTDSQKDVYQAVLIQLQFHPTYKRHGFKSYGARLERPLRMGFHTVSACLDCGLPELLNPKGFSDMSQCHLEAIADKVYRLWDENHGVLLQSCVAELLIAPSLLKHLIMRRANGSYTRLVWDSIQSRDRPELLDFYFCLAPLDVLESILFGQTISVDNVARMLSMLTGFRNYGYAVSKVEHVCYSAMFWWAPEEIVDGLLNKFPRYRELDFEVVLSLLRLTQYTRDFCQKLVRRCGPLTKDERFAILEARPDLATGLSFLD